MSGGGETVTQNAFPDWAVPAAKNFLNATQNVASLPYQAYEGQTVAQLNPYQTAGYNAQAQRALQGSPVMDQASNELQKTLSGGYLNSNPYLSGMIDLASNDVMRNMNQVDARSGSFGNSGVQYQTAKALGDVATGVRGQDYAAERARMAGAVSQAPSIANQDYIDANALQQAGAGFQGSQQANLTDQYSRFKEARDYPNQQLATLGKGLGINYGSTTTGPGANTGSQLLGAGLTGLSLFSGLPLGVGK